MHTDIEITESPNGSYAVHAEPWEARASQWIYHPSIVNLASGEILWSPSDDTWSLDKVTWESELIVRLLLRKFPGDQRPPFFEVTVDCRSGIAFVDGTAQCGVAALEQQLEEALASRSTA